MEINFEFNKIIKQIRAGEPALQVTALQYLKEAIVAERYEECAELVLAAKRFGAIQSDIKKAIAEGARNLKFGRNVEALQKKKGRRRF